jgi:hypothetical protein
MRVCNIHERELPVDIDTLGALIDTLASHDDRLWPRERWPALRFDRPLGVGATGGHGPIRYVVEEYRRARAIRFRFTGPPGFDGYHAFTASGRGDGRACLQHELVMRARGPAVLSWAFAIRPLHDALIEDAFDRAETQLTGGPERAARWSLWARLLRRLLGVGAKPA